MLCQNSRTVAKRSPQLSQTLAEHTRNRLQKTTQASTAQNSPSAMFRWVFTVWARGAPPWGFSVGCWLAHDLYQSVCPRGPAQSEASQFEGSRAKSGLSGKKSYMSGAQRHRCSVRQQVREAPWRRWRRRRRLRPRAWRLQLWRERAARGRVVAISSTAHAYPVPASPRASLDPPDRGCGRRRGRGTVSRAA